jgi:hypothetical protein
MQSQVQERVSCGPKQLVVQWIGDVCQMNAGGEARVIRRHSWQSEYRSSSGRFSMGEMWYTLGDDPRRYDEFKTAVFAAFGWTRVIQDLGSRGQDTVRVQVGPEFYECPLEDGKFEFLGQTHSLIGHGAFYEASYRVLDTTLAADKFVMRSI